MQYETKISNRKLTVLRTLTAILVFFFFLNYGKRVAASEESEEIPSSPQQLSTDPSQEDLSPIEILQKKSKAQADGKYIFFMFYERGNADCEIMGQRLDEYAKNNVEKIEIIKIDRNDPRYSPIVESMGAKTAPMPLTLLENMNGRILKKFETVASEEEIRYAIPSPKKAEFMSSLKNGKRLIISFTSQAMPSASEIEQACEEAIKIMDENVAYIKVDITDPKEEGFLKEMKINPDSSEPVTIVFNAQRLVSGTYKGEVKADDLVRSARKIAIIGGCSHGSTLNKSCGGAKTSIGDGKWSHGGDGSKACGALKTDAVSGGCTHRGSSSEESGASNTDARKTSVHLIQIK